MLSPSSVVVTAVPVMRVAVAVESLMAQVYAGSVPLFGVRMMSKFTSQVVGVPP